MFGLRSPAQDRTDFIGAGGEDCADVFPIARHNHIAIERTEHERVTKFLLPSAEPGVGFFHKPIGIDEPIASAFEIGVRHHKPPSTVTN